MNRLFSYLAEAVNGIAAKLRRQRSQAMIGLPPSARGLTGRPADPAMHAKDLAREWEDVAESYVRGRMRQLNIPDHQIGAPDYQRGGIQRVFLAEESLGGSCGTGRRLFVDSGVLNLELNADEIGTEAASVWAKSPLRDRIDAVIVHEYLEAQGIAHEDVVEQSAESDLPIGENARRILRMMAEGVRRHRGC